MGLSIVDLTHRFVAELEPAVRNAAERSACACSRQGLGCALTLEELLELLVAAKALAVGDDFERGEGQGLRMWLTRHGMPMVVQQHLLDSPGSLDLEGLRTPLEPGGLQARRLLWLVALLACFEELREEPRARLEAVGQRLGLSSGLVRVLVEEAQIAVSALLSGNDPLLRRLAELRTAIFELDGRA